GEGMRGGGRAMGGGVGGGGGRGPRRGRGGEMLRGWGRALIRGWGRALTNCLIREWDRGAGRRPITGYGRVIRAAIPGPGRGPIRAPIPEGDFALTHGRDLGRASGPDLISGRAPERTRGSPRARGQAPRLASA